MRNRKIKLFFLFQFIALIVFFVHGRLMAPYDFDDWLYLSNLILPVPRWGSWNPARIFSVDIMALGGMIAGTLVYPVTQDYMISVLWTSSVLLSFLIITVCICLYSFFIRRLKTSESIAAAAEIFFLISCFLFIRNKPSSNYMFHAADLCCVYFYIMSGLLNAVVVLIMMRSENFSYDFSCFTIVQKTGFLVLAYFAVFSNLFHSAITATYCGAMTIWNLYSISRRTEGSGTAQERSIAGPGLRKNSGNCNYGWADLIVKTIRQSSVFIAVIILWLAEVAFEHSGGRAGSFSSFDLHVSLLQYFDVLRAIAAPYKAIILISVAWSIFAILRGKKNWTVFVQIAISNILLTAFLLLLNAVTKYMSRIEASWGVWFYMILFCSAAFAMLLRDTSAHILVTVPVIVLMAILAWLPDGKFMMSNDRNLDADSVFDAGYYYTQQIINADRAGRSGITLEVPASPDGFVFAAGMGQTISHTLYYNKVTKNEIHVDEVISPHLNQRFYTDEWLTSDED